jgi:hypothetical protein
VTRIDEIAARVAALGEGWYDAGFFLAFVDDDDARMFPPEDAAFIAAARDDVPFLLAEVERLRAEIARRHGLLARIEQRQNLGLIAIDGTATRKVLRIQHVTFAAWISRQIDALAAVTETPE